MLVATPMRASRARDVVAVLFAFLLGLVGVCAYGVVTRDATNPDVKDVPSPGASAHESSNHGIAASSPPDAAGSSDAAVAAPTPGEAIARFLDAEIASDFLASYSHLNASNRALSGSAAQWVADHAAI